MPFLRRRLMLSRASESSISLLYLKIASSRESIVVVSRFIFAAAGASASASRPSASVAVAAAATASSVAANVSTTVATAVVSTAVVVSAVVVVSAATVATAATVSGSKTGDGATSSCGTSLSCGTSAFSSAATPPATFCARAFTLGALTYDSASFTAFFPLWRSDKGVQAPNMMRTESRINATDFLFTGAKVVQTERKTKFI